MTDTKMVDVEEKFVSRPTGQKVNASKYHLYRDCPVIDKSPDENVETVNNREVDLLGLSECTQCKKRRTGGPAVEVLAELLDHGGGDQHPGDAAWYILNGLKERGFYIAQRRS